MEPDNKQKKKRKKVKYSILFVPDAATADVKRFALNSKVVTTICIGVALIIGASLVYCYFLTNHLLVANTSMNTLRTQVDTLCAENEVLITENEELHEKVMILSDTINEKVQQEEMREAELAKQYLPTGFPLKGTATYNETVKSIDEQPAAMFTTAMGTKVIATASGTVSAIAGGEELGYIIMVDHGNGYFSVYRNGSSPRVLEGDSVTSDTVLFIIDEGCEELGYQIIENDAYIDPLTLMEIYG